MRCVSIRACRKLLLFHTGVLFSLLASSVTSRAPNPIPMFLSKAFGGAPPANWWKRVGVELKRALKTKGKSLESIAASDKNLNLRRGLAHVLAHGSCEGAVIVSESTR